MEALLATVEGSALAAAMRQARWGYAAVNALHILGIALLVGAILPLDLRRLGAFRSVPEAELARVLVPAAATGLLLAATTGALLVLPRAGEYLALSLFRVKLALVAGGTLLALLFHATDHLAGPPSRIRRVAGALLSAATWITVLALGRLVAFV